MVLSANNASSDGVFSDNGRRRVRISSVEIRLIRLPLREAFETSFGRIETRLIFVVIVQAEGVRGFGEVVAGETPQYSYETVGTAFHVIRDYLAPVMMKEQVNGLEDLAVRFSRFRGHNMAKAGLELAFADLRARLDGVSLSRFLGGTRDRIEVGVSIGIQPTLDALLLRVEQYLSLGYRRVKLKIKPGWDIGTVTAVRRRHPKIILSVDANSAYTLKDRCLLRELDAFDLLMIEQPLGNGDLIDHAELQSELTTPLCLDESITDLRSAEQALQLGSCRIINIKVGRVGGYSQALGIHDLCLSKHVPVWCGGMLESGIGRAHNIALASLPGFTLPGDISASSRYFDRDLIIPEVCVSRDGEIEVPSRPGLGFDIDMEYFDKCTEAAERFVVNGSR